MKESSVQIRYKDNPVLLDKILQDMQKSLMEKLKWLNYAFGRMVINLSILLYIMVIANMFHCYQMIILVIFHGLIYMTLKKLLK